MKFSAFILLSAAYLAQTAFAADANPQASVLGVWQVDTSRLTMPPEARPQSVTITFTEEAAEHLRTKVEIIDPTGAPLQAEGVTPLDGTPTAVPANFEADMSATTLPRPEVLIMQLANQGHPVSTRIYAVNPDNQSMIETVAYFNAEGQPALRRNYFSRVK